MNIPAAKHIERPCRSGSDQDERSEINRARWHAEIGRGKMPKLQWRWTRAGEWPHGRLRLRRWHRCRGRIAHRRQSANARAQACDQTQRADRQSPNIYAVARPKKVTNGGNADMKTDMKPLLEKIDKHGNDAVLELIHDLEYKLDQAEARLGFITEHAKAVKRDADRQRKLRLDMVDQNTEMVEQRRADKITIADLQEAMAQIDVICIMLSGTHQTMDPDDVDAELEKIRNLCD